jgi:hypothetical protein
MNQSTTDDQAIGAAFQALGEAIEQIEAEIETQEATTNA